MRGADKDFRIQKTPTWELLSLFGKSRLIKTSYIWFILIPILAKSIEKFKALVSTGTFSNEWIIFLNSILALPFEWKYLYYSSVFFALATVLYAIFCPKLLQKFSNWSEAESEGCGVDTLVYLFSNWLRGGGKVKDGSGDVIEHDIAVSQIVDNYCDELSDEEKNCPPWEQIASIRLKSDSEPKQLYLIMSRQMIRDKNAIRLLIASLYACGTTLFLCVLVSNFMSVIIA